MSKQTSIILIRDILHHIELCCDGWKDSETSQINEFYLQALNRDVNELNRLISEMNSEVHSKCSRNLQSRFLEAV